MANDSASSTTTTSSQRTASSSTSQSPASKITSYSRADMNSYEKEKEVLRKLSNISDEQKWVLLDRAYSQLYKASIFIFDDSNDSNPSEKILESISIWAIECDGSSNALESTFKSNYLRRTGRFRLSPSYHDANLSKLFLYSCIERAKSVVRKNEGMRNTYNLFVDAISVIFGVFAGSDSIITDNTAKALYELSKTWEL